MFFFLVLVFFVFGLLQFNDPDPILWASIYWGQAFVLLLASQKYIPPALMLTLGICTLLAGIYLWPNQFYGLTGDMRRHLEIEEARESLGLFIISCSQVGVAWHQSKAS